MRIRHAIQLLLGIVVAFWTDYKGSTASPRAVIFKAESGGLGLIKHIGICGIPGNINRLFALGYSAPIGLGNTLDFIITCCLSSGSNRALRQS